jgi:hypothetical protein
MVADHAGLPGKLPISTGVCRFRTPSFLFSGCVNFRTPAENKKSPEVNVVPLGWATVS